MLSWYAIKNVWSSIKDYLLEVRGFFYDLEAWCINTTDVNIVPPRLWKCWPYGLWTKYSLENSIVNWVWFLFSWSDAKRIYTSINRATYSFNLLLDSGSQYHFEVKELDSHTLYMLFCTLLTHSITHFVCTIFRTPRALIHSLSQHIPNIVLWTLEYVW